MPAWRCRSLARSASRAFTFMPAAAARNGTAAASATIALLTCGGGGLLAGPVPSPPLLLLPAPHALWCPAPAVPLTAPPENRAPTMMGMKKVSPNIAAAISSQQAERYSTRQSRTMPAGVKGEQCKERHLYSRKASGNKNST